MQIDTESGILYRDQTFDKWIINESRSYFPAGLQDGDIVLDLGGHIGAFAARAMQECPGINLSSIEAEASNFAVLSENAAKFNFDTLHAAIVQDDMHDKPLSLFVNVKKNNAAHSILATRGRTEQTVNGVGFTSVMQALKPTVIKCDIEGAEFLLPWAKLSEERQVRIVIMELHLTKKGHRDKAREIVDLFRTLGFEATRAPNIGEKNWTTLACWKRAV